MTEEQIREFARELKALMRKYEARFFEVSQGLGESGEEKIINHIIDKVKKLRSGLENR